jgi:hypothetical protein
MKLASSITALILSAVAIGANAQTGRPSEAPAVQPTVSSTGSGEPGSYARYLMLNGSPRDVAIEAARNIDHPAAARRLALHTASRAARTSGTDSPAPSQP